MKSLFFFLFAALFLQTAGASHINTNPEDTVLKATTQGKLIKVETVIEGEINLYRRAYREDNFTFTGDASFNTQEETRFIYFIGEKLIEEINAVNYKKLIRQYLKNAPDLHRKLGRFGFRYENVPSMIMYYNRFKARRPMEKNYDLRQISLSMER